MTVSRPRREASEEIHLADTLVSDFQPPDPQDSPFLSLRPLSMWDFVTGALANPHEDLPEKVTSEQWSEERAEPAGAVKVQGARAPRHRCSPWGRNSTEGMDAQVAGGLGGEAREALAFTLSQETTGGF